MHHQRAEDKSEASSLKPGTLTTLLQALADPALTRRQADDLSHAVLRCLREIMAADNLAILLLTEDHTALHIHTVLGIEELVARGVHIPLGQGFAGRIVMQGVPLIVHDPSPLELMTTLLREQLRSLLGVPLIVRQQAIGVLHIGMKREYLFTDEDIAILQRVAASLAQAFERTLQVQAEQDEVGELIEAQLSAVGELVKQQQQVSTESLGTQQRIAIKLVLAQQHLSVTLVGGQLQIAGELVAQQQQLAIELKEHQRQMRLKVLERVKELETIFNAITDAVIVYDEQENIIHFNQAARSFLDTEMPSIEQNNHPYLLQRTTHRLRDEYGHPFSPELLPLKRVLGGERLGAKQAVVAHLHTIDHADIQLSITGTPLYTQQGDLYGAVCVFHNVTRRKHREQRVELLEVLFQMVELLVTSSAPKEPMLTPDNSAPAIQQIENTIVVLAQRLLGCSHSIIIGIDQKQVLSPLALAGFSTEQEQRLRSALTGALLSLLITDPDTITLLEKQEVVPFTIPQSPLLASVSPLSSSPNCYLAPIRVAHQLIGVLGIVFPEGVFLPDTGGKTVITALSKLCALVLQYEQQTIERDVVMTAKILLSEQMQQLNKMQSDFIAVVSYEFRTALSTIEGFSDLLRSEDFSAEEVKDYADHIYTDALRLHWRVTDLLDFP